MRRLALSVRSPLLRLLPCVALAFTATTATTACGTSSSDASDEADITSNAGTPLELTFHGEVVADARDTARKAVSVQLQYIQGILTSDARANASTGMPALTNVTETTEGTTKRIAYDATLSVIWPKGDVAPESYPLVLPRDTTKLFAFNAKYDGTCGRNEYGQETFWHDFDPTAPACKIDEADVVRVTGKLAPHPQATQGIYPEYDKIWEDDALDIVAVYGIISSNTPTDEGARMREKILTDVGATLRNAKRVDVPALPGVIAESTVTGTIDVGGKTREVHLTAILTQEAASAGPAFEKHYEEITTKADYVVYEGHSGLGKNINALARNTGATAGKYQLVYLYGCQTLAYLEPTMHEKRIALNGEANDPEGTKFLDIVATALPAYGDNGRSTFAFYQALTNLDAPKSFNDLLTVISPIHLTATYGEHDNTFKP